MIKPDGAEPGRGRAMLRGEKLFRFLASSLLRRLGGTVRMRFGHGKLTHIETET